MTKLSVNINKIATLRNSRGENTPNLLKVAADIEGFGADGITVHPRPDERHIRYQDAYNLKNVITTEYNIEGNPIPKFKKMVLEIRPTQVTLVPDEINNITSDAGWDTIQHQNYLKSIVADFKSKGIRTSIFVNPSLEMIKSASTTGADRVELYTREFAVQYSKGNLEIIDSYIKSAQLAHDLGMGVNAGHDLNLENITFFSKNIPHLAEVSIGHALISESLYLGFVNVVNMYLNKLKG